MSRPLRAVSRRLLEVSAALALVAGVESVHRRTAHRGLGWALYQGLCQGLGMQTALPLREGSTMSEYGYARLEFGV